MSTEEATKKALEEISKAFADEGKARHEARMAVLGAVKKAANEYNSQSAHVFAQAYEKLREPTPAAQHFHYTTAFPANYPSSYPPVFGTGDRIVHPQYVGPDGIVPGFDPLTKTTLNPFDTTDVGGTNGR